MIFLDIILDILNWLKNNVWEGFVIPAHFLTILKNILNGNFVKGIII
jgi:hypothetical protein